MSKNKAIDFGYLKNAIKYYGDAISYRQKVIDLRCDKDLEDAIRQVEDANRQINEALTEMQSNTINESSSIEIVVIGESIIHFQ